MINFELKFDGLHFCKKSGFYFSATLFTAFIPFFSDIAFSIPAYFMSQYPVISKSDVNDPICYIQSEDGTTRDLSILCKNTLVDSSSKEFIPSPLTQTELARRLGIDQTSISRKQFEPDFIIWSRTLDPAGVGWNYLRETDRFYPVQ